MCASKKMDISKYILCEVKLMNTIFIQELFKVHKHKINRGAVDSIITKVESEIVSTDIVHELHLRIAKYDDCIWHDLADSAWRAIRIDENGWRIAPFLYKRPSHMQEQVVPVAGGTMSTLFDFINLQKKYRLLLLVNLIACFIPDVDYQINVFWGKPVTGKTSACRVLKSLVDPSKKDILSFPSSENEMIQVMSKNRMTVFDNTNRISLQASDILCRAST